jgi:hypothetical protein
MQRKCDPVFQKVIAKPQTHGIYDILGLHQEWNTELVAQFYDTTWRSGDEFDSTLNFSIEGHRYELTITELSIIFGFAKMTFIESQLALRGVYRTMNWHLSTFSGMRTIMAPIMVCFPSITFSTISFGTLLLRSEVTAQAFGALHGTFS